MTARAAGPIATCARPDPSRRQRPAGGGPEARLEGRRLQPQPRRRLCLPAGHRARRRHLGAGQCAQCAGGEPLHPRQHRRGVPVLPFELRGLAGAHPRGLSQDQRLLCLDLPSFDDWLAAQKETAPDLPDDPDGVAFLASSGGTTGRPKGVQITNRNIETMNSIFWACMPVDSPPVHLMVAPMTHAAGVCSFPLLPYGGTNIFMGTADPGAILAAIEKHKVTHIYMPPTLIYMLLAHPDVAKYDYSSLQHLVYASAPMSVDKLVEAIRVFGPGADPDLRPGRGLHDLHLLLARRPCRGAGEQQAPSAGELRAGLAPDAARGDGRRGPHPAARRARRDRGARRPGHGGLLQQPRPPRARPRPSAGTIPATSALSTRTASSTSSIARRT